MLLKNNRKLRNYFLVPKLQFLIVGNQLVVAGLIILAVYASNEFFFYKFAKTAKDAGLADGHQFFAFLALQKSSMNEVLLMTLFVSALIIVVSGLILSHRIAGPIFNMTRYFRDLRDKKEFKPLILRDGDFLMEASEYYNEGMKDILKDCKSEKSS